MHTMIIRFLKRAKILFFYARKAIMMTPVSITFVMLDIKKIPYS